MKKLRDASVSPSRDKPDQIICATNNVKSKESSYKKRTALINEVETKIDVLNVSKEEKDAISDAINNVFKWYETENQQLQANNDTFLNDIDIYAEESNRRNEKMQQTINKLNAKIADLQVKLSDSTLASLAKVKTLEDENTELKQTIATVDLKKIVAPLYSNENFKALGNEITALKKESSVLREQVTTTVNEGENGKFIQLKDVMVCGEIIYELLKGKILVVDTIKPYGSYCNVKYNDGKELKFFNLELDGSFKLHINGAILRGDNFLNYDPSDKCERLCKYIHSCKLKSLCAGSGDLCFNDFLKLVGSRTIESLDIRSDVKDAYGYYLPLEEMFKYFPNLRYFKMGSCSRRFSRKEASTFLKLPIFKNLETFQLYGCPDHFDLIVYNEFMKKYPKVKFLLTFDNHPPRRTVLLNKLHNDKDAILHSWPRNSPKPFIEIENERYY